MDAPINLSEMTIDLDAGTAIGTFAAALDALAGLDRIDADRLRLRGRTGLEQLPVPALLPDQPPPPVSARELIQQLQSDPELGGLARLAQNLMAAVHIPRALSAADELPMGGVSDLTNRGDFDRLLISELAQDDLTLAVRVALNEALYLRRESPPRRPPPRRAVLIDCGIRLWGVGRVFASAVAMALAAGSDPKGELAVYRASGAGVAPVDLGSRAGIIALLEALEPHPHPGAALPAFLEAARGSDAAGIEVEWLLVTHADVLADPEFNRNVAPLADKAWFAATVNRDGAFALTAVSARGRRPVCSADLSLDELMAPPPAAPAPLPLRVDGDDLPAILTCHPLPLRLPFTLAPKRAVVSDLGLGLFGTTSDGRALWWEGPDHGPRQLTDLMPPRRMLGLFIDHRRGQVHLVAHDGKFNQLHHVAIDLSNRQVERRQITMNAPLWAHYHEPDGALFLISRKTVRAVNLMTGMEYRLLYCPDAAWTNGRFMKGLGKRYALAISDSQVVLEPVTSDAGLVLLDQEDQLCLLLEDGSVDALDGELPLPPNPPFPGPVSLVGVSPDSNRVVVRGGAGTQGGSAPTPATYFRDFRAIGGWRQVEAAEVPRLLAGVQIAWSLDSRIRLSSAFSGMFVDSQGELRLMSGGVEGMSHRFLLNNDGDLIFADVGVARASQEQFKAFEACAPPPGRRYSLRVARWRDGSRAYLDGRGMLHLQSSESIPGISLVLSNTLSAGCSSDGKTFGLRYFLDGKATSEPAYALELIRQFTLRLR